MGKYLLSFVLSVALIFLGGVVLQYGINTFNPYFGFDFNISYVESVFAFILLSVFSSLVNVRIFTNMSAQLDSTGAKHPQSMEEIFSSKIAETTVILLVWAELWILNLIVF